MGRAFEYRKARKLKRWGTMAKVFTKLGKEIAIAVKSAGPDPIANSRLRVLMQNAKTANMPNKHICRPCCPMLIGTPQDRRALPYTRQPQDNVCRGSGGRDPAADSKAFSAGQQAAPARQDSPQWFLPCSP